MSATQLSSALPQRVSLRAHAAPSARAGRLRGLDVASGAGCAASAVVAGGVAWDARQVRLGTGVHPAVATGMLARAMRLLKPDVAAQVRSQLSAATCAGDTMLAQMPADSQLPALAIGQVLVEVSQSMLRRLARRHVRASASALVQVRSLHAALKAAWNSDAFTAAFVPSARLSRGSVTRMMALEMHVLRMRAVDTAEHVKLLGEALDTQIKVVPSWRARLQELRSEILLHDAQQQPYRALGDLVELLGTELDEFSAAALKARNTHRALDIDTLRPWIELIDTSCANAPAARKLTLWLGRRLVRLRKSAIEALTYRGFGQSRGPDTSAAVSGCTPPEELALNYYEIRDCRTASRNAAWELRSSNERVMSRLEKLADDYAQVEQRLGCVRMSVEMIVSWLELNVAGDIACDSAANDTWL